MAAAGLPGTAIATCNKLAHFGGRMRPLFNLPIKIIILTIRDRTLVRHYWRLSFAIERNLMHFLITFS